MKRLGFTLIELLVVITILGILMSIGTITISGSLGSARDKERISDAETIALHLENFYKYGSDKAVDDSGAALPYPTEPGQYPRIGDDGIASEYTRQILRDIDEKSLIAPNASGPDLSLEVATVIDDLKANADSMNESQYIYQPLSDDGAGGIALCNSTLECRRFNLYYKLENTPTNTDICDTTTKICKIESKHQ